MFSTVTLGYTSRLRTSLTLAQPTIGNWTHAYTWDNARRLDTLTGSSGYNLLAGVRCRRECRGLGLRQRPSRPAGQRR